MELHRVEPWAPKDHPLHKSGRSQTTMGLSTQVHPEGQPRLSPEQKGPDTAILPGKDGRQALMATSQF